GYDHKSGGSGAIANVVALGGTAFTYTNDPRLMTWRGGTPTASGSTTGGLYIAGRDHGFRLILPADTTVRTIQIYIGGWASTGKLTAHLSDGSNPDFIDTSLSGTAQYDGVYTLTFNAATSGQQLTLDWTQASSAGNVTVQGAALH
ncbi:MAG TPA: hypothetical protein VMV45_16795, partial [Casimicrobiaceae bacterium]|nr:hypothetical protein [Casimicrobiaceae bacterium]